MLQEERVENYKKMLLPKKPKPKEEIKKEEEKQQPSGGSKKRLNQSPKPSSGASASKHDRVDSSGFIDVGGDHKMHS